MGAEQSKPTGGKPTKSSRGKLFSRKRDKSGSSSSPGTPKHSTNNFSSTASASTSTTPTSNTTSSPKEKESPVPKISRPGVNIDNKRGLKICDFLNVETQNYKARIDLLKGAVDNLHIEDDKTDVLVVYLKKKGAYKANHGSAMAAINRAGLNLEDFENDVKEQTSYREHYHCWLSKQIRVDKQRAPGFHYKRFLVYEDRGGELNAGGNIVLDVMKCLATVAGGDRNVDSVMIPLIGQMLSKQQRKHFVKACTITAYTWLKMGLPIKQVRILLPDEDDLDVEFEAFRKTAAECKVKYDIKMNVINYDIFFSYSEADQQAAEEMMQFIKDKNPSVRIFDAKPRSVEEIQNRGYADMPYFNAISQSRLFFSLLSDEYFKSVENTEHFSLAACRDVDADGSFVLPVWWKKCDLTPLARRLIQTEGYDCREADMDKAKELLLDISAAIEEKNASQETGTGNEAHNETTVENALGDDHLNMGEKFMMEKTIAQKDDHEDAKIDLTPEEGMMFDENWISKWATPISSIVFGPRIGAGGFGEVYKCKWDSKMVAVKTLQKIEDEDPASVYAEFMVEMRLMSKLHHNHVVTFLGASIEKPRPAIILEFMAGGSLYRAISRRRRNGYGPFPLLKSLWIAFGIAKGMTYLHAQNPCVIHRDLKSPNILLGTNVREVKVTDFGLSRLKPDTFVNTGPGGTPEWMAPELLRQDKFNELSDVFSFGVILWELMMCEKPWKDDHPMQIVFKVGSRGEILPLPDPALCIPDVRDLIDSCFRKDPDSRPRFSEITAKLDELCHNPDIAKRHQK